MKQSITEFSAQDIEAELTRARDKHNGVDDSIRIIFSPVRITESNISHTASIYSRLSPTEYDTVVVVEEHKENINKRLSMPSNEAHQTPLGNVPVNDYLRNEFCDEDDDFFINEFSFHPDLSLCHQLMMLQAGLDDFKVLNIQISDRDETIVIELVSAINELLSSRNILLVFCCDLDDACQDEVELKKLKNLAVNETTSNMFNLLNRYSDYINGSSAFTAGMLLARTWGANVHFPDEYEDIPTLAAYAQRERVFY